MLPSNPTETIPLFPEWVFKTRIGVTEEHVNRVLSEMPKIPAKREDYGFITPKSKVGPGGLNLAKLMAASFQSLVETRFQLSQPHVANLESVDYQFMAVAPLCKTPAQVNRLRWYNGALILKKAQMGSDLCIENFGTSLQTVPFGVQSPRHTVELKELDVVFWPAQHPWHFTVNAANSDFLAFVSTFIITNQHNLPEKK